MVSRVAKGLGVRRIGQDVGLGVGTVIRLVANAAPAARLFQSVLRLAHYKSHMVEHYGQFCLESF
jgi:hypothetical protein